MTNITFGGLEYYLLGINVFGFLLYLLDLFLHRHTQKAGIGILLYPAGAAGGSIGILLCMLLFHRKPEKETMMLRVFTVCICVTEVLLFLMYKGHRSEPLTLAFWEYFAERRYLLIYLAVINFAAFAAYAVDKVHAAEHKSRIRIVTLLALAFIGGSAGSLLAVYLLNHKTRKNYFTIGIPMMMIMQLTVLFFAMNMG
ncbi:MAG: DUF1294 domain-containing protein [Eubacteriales bacterium]|nr:DUF1294 domain-containing protein [Eubacteriales bacterium]